MQYVYTKPKKAFKLINLITKRRCQSQHHPFRNILYCWIIISMNLFRRFTNKILKKNLFVVIHFCWCLSAKRLKRKLKIHFRSQMPYDRFLRFRPIFIGMQTQLVTMRKNFSTFFCVFCFHFYTVLVSLVSTKFKKLNKKRKN